MNISSAIGSLTAASLLAIVPPAAAQQPLDGRWNGAILVMGQSLTIHVDFKTTVEGVAATIDIPQQGAAGLALTNVRHEPPRVHFELPAGPGLAVFDGDQRGDSIAGQFTQAGIAGSFTLARGATEPPAEATSAEPPPYREEEVTFSSGDVTLAGTLTLPTGAGPHPAVVMITGSGPQNRDEEIFGFKPFRIIADHLTRHGVAVLRYDDRGVGGSTGNVSLATTADFANDALAAVTLLRARPDIDGRHVGLLGHSEGGIVAPLAAVASEDVAFLVLLAATAVTGEQILYAQGELIRRAGGASEEVIAQQRDVQRAAFQAARTGEGWDIIESELRRQAAEAIDSLTPEEREAITDIEAFLDTRVQAGIQSLQTPWFRYFLDYDPVPTLRQVRVPVLALFGDLDLQVPPDLNREPMAAALAAAGNDDVTIRVIPRANHLFLTATTGSPAEYATLEKTFVPGFLETISTWIRKRSPS